MIVLKKGKNYGETYPLNSNTMAFEDKEEGENYLKEQGFVLTPQGYGSPLWISEEKNEWADLVELTVKKKGDK